MTVLRLTTPIDVIASVPILLGFMPEESVVFLITESAGGSFHVRCDLPDTADDCDALAGQLGLVFERQGVTSAVMLFYTVDPDVTERADRLLLGFANVDFKALFHVTPTTYRSLRSADTEAIPYDLSTHPLIADAVVEGRVVLQTLADVANSLNGEVTGEVASSYRSHVELARTVMHDEGAWRQFRRGEALWARATMHRARDENKMLTDAEVGRMAAALVPLDVRDVAWAQINRENASFFKEFFRDLTRRVPSETIAAPACLFAFAAWQSGDGASARIGVEHAQEAEPGYSMAGLILHTLTLGINPATWTPQDESELPIFQEV